MYKVAIITASDKGYAGEREDKSGSVIEEIVTAHELEVTGKVILPDDRQILSDQMLNYCHQGIDLILTTGGTGFSKRVEYWFLLHFNMYRGYIHRNDYEQMLSQQMKVKYCKKDNFTTKIYGMLLPYQSDAILRARKILAEFGNTSPSLAVSSTTVFKLVEELNRFI